MILRWGNPGATVSGEILLASETLCTVLRWYGFHMVKGLSVLAQVSLLLLIKPPVSLP